VKFQLGHFLKKNTRAGPIVINEFLADPNYDWDGSGALDYGDDEWIELYNKGDASVDISGWQLDDVSAGGTSPYSIPGGTSIGPGEVMVFYGSQTGVGLNNAGDWVNLLDDQSGIVDFFQFDSTADDISIARIPDGVDNWESINVPTPGELNSPIVQGGGGKLVTDNNYASEAIGLIEEADDYVYVLQYLSILYPSHPEYSVSQLYQSLIDAHGRGADVRFLMDNTPPENNDTKDHLIGNGVEVKMDGNDIKLHSKMVVADDKVLLGSTNWDLKSTFENHEANVLVNSTAVGTFFKSYYESIWADQTTCPTLSAVDHNGIKTVVCDEYYDEAAVIIDGASDEIRLIMYHISESQAAQILLSKIENAYNRGVDVKVILEQTTYMDYVSADNLNALDLLRESRIPSVVDSVDKNTHAKLILCDDKVLLGSTNWAYEALYDQLNTNLLVSNSSFADQASDYFSSLWDIYGTATGTLEISGGIGDQGTDFYTGEAVTVIVNDKDANGNSTKIEELQLSIYSDSDNEGITFSLTESGDDTGIFQGQVTLSSSSSKPDSEIKVMGGDEVTVIYDDLYDEDFTEQEISFSFDILLPQGSVEPTFPDKGDIINTTSIELQWDLDYSGSGGVRFDVLLGAETPPSGIVASFISDTTTMVTGLKDGETYYWKVIPYVDGDLAVWSSAVFDFTVELDVLITLTQPSNRSWVYGYNAELAWDFEYIGNQKLTFDIFMGVEQDELEPYLLNNSGSLVNLWDLEDGATYYWCIKARLNWISRGPQSEIFHFSVSYPVSIGLLFPSLNGLVSGQEVGLEWNYTYNGSSTLQFIVIIGDSPGINGTVINGVSSNYTLLEGLQDMMSYYWRVVPVLDGIESPHISEQWIFTVEMTGIITLKEPSNGANIEGEKADLKWELDYPGKRQVTYSVLVGTVNPPRSEYADELIQSNHTFILDQLPENGGNDTTYYWSVQPFLDGEIADWSSPVWNFTLTTDSDPNSPGGGIGDDDLDDDGGNNGYIQENSDDGSSSNAVIIVVLVLVLLIILAVVIFVLVKIKKGSDTDDDGDEVGDFMITPDSSPWEGSGNHYTVGPFSNSRNDTAYQTGSSPFQQNDIYNNGMNSNEMQDRGLYAVNVAISTPRPPPPRIVPAEDNDDDAQYIPQLEPLDPRDGDQYPSGTLMEEGPAELTEENATFPNYVPRPPRFSA